MRSSLITLFAALALGFPAAAQSNQDPSIDVYLGEISNLAALGRTGTYPNGNNGFSFQTTICNRGSSAVNWLAPMDPDHPFISFLIARESDGRMVQISDRSYLKHGFFAANSNLCTPCTFPSGPNGSKLGLGCSDTYGIFNNGDRYWLGPADEIDPWLGLWDEECSYFDRGDPAISPPSDCNSARSLTRTQVNQFDDVKNRIVVSDADLQVPGTFYYQAYYTVATEAEAVRNDDQGSRRFNPTWNGSSWSTNSTSSLIVGPVLGNWTGSTMASNTNGTDDGRVFVAVKVTGPKKGMYHYEYAIQNRDNKRGVGAFRIPLCDDAQVTGFGFKDVDGLAANDWNVTQSGGELVFSTPDNPVRWNSLYNFWFDSDAAPESANLTLDAFDAGAGSPSFDVSLTAPLGLYNQRLGDGCSNGTAPELFATGPPARALLGNSNFGVASSGNTPGTRVLLFMDLGDSFGPQNGCRLFKNRLPTTILTARVRSNGVAKFNLPIPNNVAYEGMVMDLQTISTQGSTRPKLGGMETSNGLRVRIGNSIPGCP